MLTETQSQSELVACSLGKTLASIIENKEHLRVDEVEYLVRSFVEEITEFIAQNKWFLILGHCLDTLVNSQALLLSVVRHYDVLEVLDDREQFPKFIVLKLCKEGKYVELKALLVKVMGTYRK